MKDLIIIGAGPIGLACGIEAEKIQFVVAHLVVDNGLRGKTMSVPLLSYHRKL